MASTLSFCCCLLVVPLLVGFLFLQVSWCSQLPPTCLIFQCPLQLLVCNLHICWGTVGCSLCSSVDRLDVSPMCRGKWTPLPPIWPPSSFSQLVDLFFHLGHFFFFVSAGLLCIRGGDLGIRQGGATHVSVL